MQVNYYEVLQVEKTITKEEIKKAYRKLAMKYHPDRAPDDRKKEYEEKFKKINEAYAILGDDEKRKKYDTFGSVDGGIDFGSGFDVDLSEFFQDFFGGGIKNKKNNFIQGEDIEEVLKIDLKTSIYGGKVTIKFNKKIICDICKGVGGEGKKTCFKCGGNGKITYTNQTIFGVVQQTAICDNCNGTGEEFEKKCNKCNGNKRVLEKHSLEIEVPAGIQNGMGVKLEGEGNEGLNKNGDLYIKFVFLDEEKGLKRVGYNLYYDLEIDVLEAILGTKKEINIPIIGKINIEIKAGTQVGTILEIPKAGVKYINNDRKGNLYLKLNIKIPKKLSKNEKKIYLELAKEKKINVNNEKGIFEKIFG